jgi:peptidoglycan/LPS O-acetylase OafA/YrhL
LPAAAAAARAMPATRAIPAGLSLYLDLVRFLAAASVLFYHTWALYFPHSGIKWPGHEAVVIFFVLSGYVIAHAATAPGMTLSTYVQHRVARIVPVAYAALLLALVISLLLPTAEPQGGLWWRTVANMLFIAQSGPLTLGAPLNPPFWSLNYEVWYYVMFGIWTFAPARRRWPLVMLAALLAGPKILLLLPVWLFGVVLYRHMPRLRPELAWCCLAVSLAAAALLTWLDVSDLLRDRLYATVPGAWRAHYSSQFLYDILLGLVVMLHFTAVASLGSSLGWLVRLQRPIRYLAGCTFTLYVFHGPLMELLRQAGSLRDSPWLFYLAIMGCVLVLAELTERRVKHYRAVLRALSARLSFMQHA